MLRKGKAKKAATFWGYNAIALDLLLQDLHAAYAYIFRRRQADGIRFQSRVILFPALK